MTFPRWLRLSLDGLFVPLGFVVFNLGDTIGRNLPWLPRRQPTILLCVLARLAMAAAFLKMRATAPASNGKLVRPLTQQFVEGHLKADRGPRRACS